MVKETLLKKFRDKKYRDLYIERNNRKYIAHTLRKLRGKKTQAEFAKEIDKNQVVISRLESPDYGGMTLRTLREITAALDLAVYIEIVTPEEFIELSRQRLIKCETDE